MTDCCKNEACALEAIDERERERVIKAFFRDGRLMKSPAKMSKRNICYRIILEKFEIGKCYPEKEVNALICEVFEDYCEVRRHFVDYGWMTRENGVYRRTE